MWDGVKPLEDAALWSFGHRRSSEVTDLFAMQFATTTACGLCTYNGVKFGTFYDFQLPLSKPTLIGNLDVYFASIMCDFTCSQCKQTSSTTTRCTKIMRLPTNLMIHLGRHEGYYTKNNMVVDVPFMLDMNPYKHECCNGSTNYELYGAVMHRGLLNSGHYWSVVKAGTRWYMCNDTDVYPISQKDCNFTNAYLLFYRACG